jgi:hypothetical protein
MVGLTKATIKSMKAEVRRSMRDKKIIGEKYSKEHKQELEMQSARSRWTKELRRLSTLSDDVHKA